MAMDEVEYSDINDNDRRRRHDVPAEYHAVNSARISDSSEVEDTASLLYRPPMGQTSKMLRS